ncbi:nucleotidyltransferase/DNA polymerase involved in DNA repair [Thioflavicoccus mobilis 8321]|uniref:Nucleotidyltransferase/DNA polymerase involved in DNA repair n=1 Tax=Thioflavicoccus mobilis 8321 TaxID=765912 RepID=L0GUE5_9GAMM|nr:DNA polymerase Y family protein [Thioflavicoccus mobilis]AGA90398.1 nucleotidyltransferase/DNA polymerase involved in DNA repair [Thioflavicoccus mobilis 8321]
MDRTACVELPAFPLQLLRQRHPEWRDHPVAVVDRDRPQGRLLWTDERARRFGIRTGMRFATALALGPELRAAEVSPAQTARAVAEIARRLHGYSPRVEPAIGEPGVFWLDATGLAGLYPSLRAWAEAIAGDLAANGLHATIVVGFRRFATYALAKAGRGITSLSDPHTEQAALRDVPLERLAIEPQVRDALARLGILTLGRLLELPAEGVGRRYGPAALELHRLASGDMSLPLQPERPILPPTRRLVLDEAETDAERLVHLIERLLTPLMTELAERGQILEELRLLLRFEHLGKHRERLRPAAPTGDTRQLLELVRLRLAQAQLPEGVEELWLAARPTTAEPRQTELLGERPRRDLEAADRALARVRAALGEQSVVRARLGAGHLPENGFDWEPLPRLAPARPPAHRTPCLVRRLYRRPLPLDPSTTTERDHDSQPDTLIRAVGPYLVAGGWWVRPVQRAYYFFETRDGALLWAFYDRLRRRWFLHGRVE